MLYPIKKPIATHQMKRDIHTLFFQEYGTKSGIPIIFLHGGPGSGCAEWQKSLFDSSIYRVIFLDQRGAGKSTPKRLLKNNTLTNLIDDLEHIREFLKINSWFIVGGSWGSTLAIAYSEKYPKHVAGMVLRSLFLGTNEEVNWAFRKGPLIFKPLLINELNKILGNKLDQSPIKKLGRMLTSKYLKDICIAAELWQEYEKNLSSISSKSYDFKSILEKKTNLNLRVKTIPNTPFLENHYIKNNFFLRNRQLMENRKVLKDIPISVIQGEYDLLCPPINSLSFSMGLPKLKIIHAYGAGHYVSDPGVKELMKREIDELQNL
ncbi:alpha/beta hydrolase [Alphaproteobacteria bacterium]|nr:alpha/beta hydrolase [Alphaproteobacteria bacterium]